jgi:hypothetical protein
VKRSLQNNNVIEIAQPHTVIPKVTDLDKNIKADIMVEYSLPSLINNNDIDIIQPQTVIPKVTDLDKDIKADTIIEYSLTQVKTTPRKNKQINSIAQKYVLETRSICNNYR